MCLPENGDTGVVEPAGETGGEAFWYPGGLTIMILRVTLVVASSGESSQYDLTLPPSVPDHEIKKRKRNQRKSFQKNRFLKQSPPT